MSQLDIRQVAERYFARIHRAALVLSGNPWDADDLAQETFLVLSRQSSQFRGTSSIYTWLYGILLNLERSQRRRSGLIRQKLQVVWNDENGSSRAPSASEMAAEAAEWRRSLWSHVAELPDPQRHALTLRFSEQLSYADIAEVLQCPLGTVKSRIFHGLAALRERMRQEFDSPDIAHPIPEDASHAI